MDRSTPEQVYQLWKPEWEAIHKAGLYFGLTCHPECIGKLSRLKVLERLISEAKDGGEVWFPTGKQLADWTRKKLK
jgi:hypothetical protein